MTVKIIQPVLSVMLSRDSKYGNNVFGVEVPGTLTEESCKKTANVVTMEIVHKISGKIVSRFAFRPTSRHVRDSNHQWSVMFSKQYPSSTMPFKIVMVRETSVAVDGLIYRMLAVIFNCKRLTRAGEYIMKINHMANLKTNTPPAKMMFSVGTRVKVPVDTSEYMRHFGQGGVTYITNLLSDSLTQVIEPSITDVLHYTLRNRDNDNCSVQSDDSSTNAKNKNLRSVQTLTETQLNKLIRAAIQERYRRLGFSDKNL